MKKQLVVLFIISLLVMSIGVGVKANEDLEIVHFSPHTGSAANYGYFMTESAELAVEEINESGGVTLPNGDTIEINYQVYDETSTSSGAITAVRKGISDDPHVMLGPNRSGGVMASKALWEQARIPTIMDCTGADATNEDNEYTYRMQISTDYWVPILARTAIENYGFEKPAVIYSENEYSESNYNSLVKTLELFPDIELVETQSIQMDDNDFTGQITRIEDADPDSLFLFAYTENAGRILRQLNELGLGDLPVLTERIGTVPAVKELAGDSNYEGTVTSTTWAMGEPDPKKEEFSNSFLEKYGEDRQISPTHVNHYDSVYIIKEIVERVGLDREKINEELQNVDYEGALAHYVTDEEGNLIHEMYTQIYENGEWKVLRRETYPPLSEKAMGYEFRDEWVETGEVEIIK